MRASRFLTCLVTPGLATRGDPPDTSNEDIIHRLDRLVEREGSVELRRPGLLRPDDGYKLVADSHRELVERVAELLAPAGVGLSELASVVDDLKKVYEAETEPDE